MEYNYISGPSNCVHMEGNSVDFRKTFDLKGTNNDQMLRMYLRKAGLSDQIECLSPEQRRAFIYDIIKSGKQPGHWMPSTMKTSAFAMPPPSVRPPPPPPARPPPPQPMVAGSPSPFAERRTNTMSASSSSSSLQSIGSGSGGGAAVAQGSPIVPHRFVTAPTTPPPPTNVLTSGKGTRYEISGPINFKHVNGDMTRDMSRNAFDLAPSMNDNVLKKYMIEHGITEDDISGMRKHDLILKIVQSKFTWMPPKRNSTPPPQGNTSQPNIVYATFSTNNQLSPPATPLPTTTGVEPHFGTNNDPVSNFSLVTSRFADPSEFPSPQTLYNDFPQQSASVPAKTPPPQSPVLMMPPLQRPVRPDPPPRKLRNTPEFLYEGPTPPPPSSVMVAVNPNGSYQSEIGKTQALYATIQPARADNRSTFAPIAIISSDAIYARPKTKKKSKQPLTASGGIPVPPPPPKIIMSNSGRPLPPTQPPMMMLSNNGGPPPPPPMMKMSKNGGPPPPPPMMMMSNDGGPPPPPPMMKMSNNGGPPPPPPMMMMSNNGGPPPPPPMMVKSNNGGPPPPPPMMEKSNHGGPPPPPPKMMKSKNGGPPPPPPMMMMSNDGGPPPPPPMMVKSNNGGPPPSPPMMMMSNNGGPPPPPPPPLLGNHSNQQRAPATVSAAETSGDPRDAFLESIRKGVTLKKLNQKAATISGVKPRLEQKPPAKDFLSELKLGLTLRRVKNSADNPFAEDEPDESHA